MRAVARSDFKYDIIVDRNLELTMREVCPHDFYWFSLVQNDFPDLTQAHFSLLVLLLLSEVEEEELSKVKMRHFQPLQHWIMKELIQEKVMGVPQWLEMAFHLQKQRWDSSIDWLEGQPMSKILLMNDIQGKFVEEQNREMKRKK